MLIELYARVAHPLCINSTWRVYIMGLVNQELNEVHNHRVGHSHFVQRDKGWKWQIVHMVGCLGYLCLPPF